MASWDKQPYETSLSYARFQQFIMLGPERSYQRLSTLLGLAKRTIEQMGGKYNWHDRATDYDNHVASEAMVVHRDNILRYDTSIRSEAMQDHSMLVEDWRRMYGELMGNTSNLKPSELEALIRSREMIDKFGRRQLGMPNTYKDKEDNKERQDGGVIPLTWHDAPSVIPGRISDGQEDPDTAASSEATEDL